MDKIVYGLCALGSALCAWKLIVHFKRTGSRLLLWSSICFIALVFANVLLYVDLIILPVETDLSLIRTLTTLVGAAVLLFGLIWETV